MNDFNNFDRISQDLARRAQALDGQQVPFDQLFPNAFMAGHTRFASFDMLLEQCGFEMETPEDFKQVVATDEWNRFIAEHSVYANWEAMLAAAGEEWLARQMKI